MTLITVNNVMQHDYQYELVAAPGENFDSRFKPELTPYEMLEMGIFGGLYLNDALRENEYPHEWWAKSKIVTDNCPAWSLNYYSVKAGQPLAEWRRKGWIDPRDPRGWFEWYCRYWMGRRCSDPWDGYDDRQIKRWVNFGPRHITMLKQRIARAGPDKAKAHQQALLQWAYDPRRI